MLKFPIEKTFCLSSHIFRKKSADIVKLDCVGAWWPINCYKKNRNIGGNGNFYCTHLK